MSYTFRAGPLLRFSRFLILVGGPWLCWIARKNDDPGYVYLAFLIALIALWLWWPRTITLDEEGIHQRDLFGRLKQIPWTSVDSLGHLADENKTIVGGGKTEIVLSYLHNDKELFCRIIRERTGKEVFVGLVPSHD